MDYNNRFRETLDRNAEFGERKGDAEYDVSEKTLTRLSITTFVVS